MMTEHALDVDTLIQLILAEGGRVEPSRLQRELAARGYDVRQVHDAIQKGFEDGRLIVDSQMQLEANEERQVA